MLIINIEIETSEFFAHAVPVYVYRTSPPPFAAGSPWWQVLVAGVNTGTAKAKVKVRLRERAWQGVEPDIIKLLVIENMMLQPSMDVYILPLSFVEYGVEKLPDCHLLTQVYTLNLVLYTNNFDVLINCVSNTQVSAVSCTE